MTKKTSSKTNKSKKFEYKALKSRAKVAPEIAIKAVEKIMEIVGITDLSALHVEQLCHYIEKGALQVDGDQIFYNLKKAITVHDGKSMQRFKLAECNDGDLLERSIDIISHVRAVQSGEGADPDTVRLLVGACLGIPVDFATGLTPVDIMTVYSLYSLFFIGM